MSLIDNKKKYAIVIGGSGEIGKYLCLELERKKITPIVCSYSKRKINSKYYCFHVDLTNTRKIDNFLSSLKKKFNNIEYIFHLASGGLELKKITRFNKQKLLNDFNIAVSGPLKIISFVISNYFLKEKKGSINSVLSEAMGVQGNELMQLMGSYLISKNALKAMLDVIKKEFKWIEVNYLFLGFVQTKFINVFDRRFLQIVSRKKKILKPQDAAKLIIKGI